MRLRGKIGTKITIFVTVLFVLAMAVTGFSSYIRMSQSMTSMATADMKTILNDNSTIIQSTFTSYKTSIENFAQAADVRSSDRTTQTDALSKLVTQSGFYRLGVGDLKGNVYFSSDTPVDFSGNSSLQQAIKTGKTVISDPFSDKSLNGARYILIATPYYDLLTNDVSGVLVGELPEQKLKTVIWNIKVQKTGYAFITDNKDEILESKTDTLSGMNIKTEAEKNKSLQGLATVVTSMAKGESKFTEYDNQGVDSYVGYMPISGTDWFLALTVPRSELLGQADQMGIFILVLNAAFVLFMIIVMTILSRVLITAPLKKSVVMLKELAKGHLSNRLKVHSGDEAGQLASAMNDMADNLQQNVLGAMNKIAQGDLHIEASGNDEQDEITPVIKSTALAVQQIANDSQKLITAASRGQLDERLRTEGYQGSWKELADSMNSLMDSIVTPVNEVRDVVKLMAVNDFTHEVSSQYQGLFGDLAADINAVRSNLLSLQDVIIGLSKGDTDRLDEFTEIGKYSDNDNLLPSIITTMQTIRSLIEEVKYLTEQTIAGNVVNARGEAGKFEGGYKLIVEGFNGTLDAISKPLSEMLQVLSALSVNDFTASMSDGYQGDYNAIKTAVDKVTENLTRVQNAAVKISLGDISDLKAFQEMGKASENDQLQPAFIGMMESIGQLIADTTQLSTAAAGGDLTVRGDAQKFSGEYFNIITSINELLDAVENPINKATFAMTELAQAKFDTTVEGEYKGSFAVLINAVNTTTASLREIVSRVSKILIAMSQGWFNLRQLDNFDGDFDKVSTALNTILDSLNNLLGDINIAAEQVAAGSMQVSDGSQQLSQGATEQASSVEELTATIAQIAAQTKQNAENANQANKLAQAAKENAEKSNAQIGEMLQSMRDIEEGSKSISKIIKVIDDIAFQTNILALNAAVEAARAGQAGKGFAVVAEEVRNLASRSAEAAKSTSEMIENSIKRVASGTKIANGTAEAFANIVDGIGKVTNLVGEIAVASNEQATGISFIDRGIDQVSRVVQTNSATAEESAAASEELSSQAEHLKEMISQFKLRDIDEDGTEDILESVELEAPALEAAVNEENTLFFTEDAEVSQSWEEVDQALENETEAVTEASPDITEEEPVNPTEEISLGETDEAEAEKSGEQPHEE